MSADVNTGIVVFKVSGAFGFVSDSPQLGPISLPVCDAVSGRACSLTEACQPAVLLSMRRSPFSIAATHCCHCLNTLLLLQEG